MNENEEAQFKTQSESLQDSAVDALVYDFLSTNEDFELDIRIRWEEDLGLKITLMSGDESVARSGDAVSATAGIRKLIAKGVPRVQEQREYKARVEAAFAADLAEDEDD